jgi:hypothetical protein
MSHLLDATVNLRIQHKKNQGHKDFTGKVSLSKQIFMPVPKQQINTNRQKADVNPGDFEEERRHHNSSILSDNSYRINTEKQTENQTRPKTMQ